VRTARRPSGPFSNRTTCSEPPVPIGITRRPVSPSWSDSGGGTSGNAAETRTAS
jgi:hypothetical protein